MQHGASRGRPSELSRVILKHAIDLEIPSLEYFLRGYFHSTRRHDGRSPGSLDVVPLRSLFLEQSCPQIRRLSLNYIPRNVHPLISDVYCALFLKFRVTLRYPDRMLYRFIATVVISLSRRWCSCTRPLPRKSVSGRSFRQSRNAFVGGRKNKATVESSTIKSVENIDEPQNRVANQYQALHENRTQSDNFGKHET